MATSGKKTTDSTTGRKATSNTTGQPLTMLPVNHSNLDSTNLDATSVLQDAPSQVTLSGVLKMQSASESKNQAPAKNHYSAPAHPETDQPAKSDTTAAVKSVPATPSQTALGGIDKSGSMLLTPGEITQGQNGVSELDGESSNDELGPSMTVQLRNHLAGKPQTTDNEATTAGKPVASQVISMQQDWDNTPMLDVNEVYDLHDIFAEGGQGTLSLALDHHLHRKIAVKALRQEKLDNAEERMRFIEEARLTASLDHPSVVPVYSINTDAQNGLYCGMKLISGRTLKEYLANIRAIYKLGNANRFDEAGSLSYRLDIFLRACDALSYAHSKNIIHCDLKPENIMLGEFHEVYVMDWGLAHEIYNHEPADTDRVFGTPRYTSPENLNRQRQDARSDIYTMGVILFELVTLGQAFPGGDETEIIRNVRANHLAPFKHRYGCRISRDLIAIIKKATAIDPADRYQTIAAMSDDIRRHIRDEEVTALPDSTFNKISRTISHHSRLFTALIISLITMGIASYAIEHYTHVAKVAVREKVRDDIVNLVYTNAVTTAWKINRQTSILAAKLEELNSNLTMLRNYNDEQVGGKKVFMNMEELRRYQATQDAADLIRSPYRTYALSLDKISYLPEPGAKERQVEQVLNKLTPILPVMRKIFETGSGGKPLDSITELSNAFTYDKLPLSSVYFSLDDNVHCVYPGTTDYPATYDGHTQMWYTAIVNEPTASWVWTGPAADTSSKGNLVLTCSSRIMDEQGRLLGVSALDMPQNVLLDFLSKEPLLAPSTQNVSRMIVNHSGQIIAGVDCFGDGNFRRRQGRKSSNNRLLPETLDNNNLLDIFYDRGNGKLYTKERGYETLWVFVSIQILDWLYIQRIDFNTLITPEAIGNLQGE